MQTYFVSLEINMTFQENSMVKHAQHAGSNTTSETDVPPKAIYKWDGGTEERDCKSPGGSNCTYWHNPVYEAHTI